MGGWRLLGLNGRDSSAVLPHWVTDVCGRAHTSVTQLQEEILQRIRIRLLDLGSVVPSQRYVVWNKHQSGQWIGLLFNLQWNIRVEYMKFHQKVEYMKGLQQNVSISYFAGYAAGCGTAPAGCTWGQATLHMANSLLLSFAGDTSFLDQQFNTKVTKMFWNSVPSFNSNRKNKISFTFLAKQKMILGWEEFKKHSKSIETNHHQVYICQPSMAYILVNGGWENTLN